jgi:hypothetical protein
MPTLDDLRTAFEATAADAPTTGQLLSRLEQRRHRRPWRAPLLAAVAVIAVVVGVLVPITLLRGHDRPLSTNSGRPAPTPVHQPTATSAPQPSPKPTPKPAPKTSLVPTRFVYDFRFQNTDAIHFTYNGILPHRQLADVFFGPNSGGDAQVTVYDKGAFNSSLATGGTRVAINGHPGYVASFADPYDPLTPTKLLSVAWPFADGSWAVVSANDPNTKSPSQIIAAAKQVRPGLSAQLRIPLKVSYLPRGVVRESVGPDTAGATVGFTDGGRPDPQMAPFSGIGDAFEVRVGTIADCDVMCRVDKSGHAHVKRQGGYDIDLGAPVSVNHHEAFYNAESGLVTVITAQWYYTVQFTGGGANRFSEQELLAVARSVVVAPQLTDPGTWYDANTAIRS